MNYFLSFLLFLGVFFVFVFVFVSLSKNLLSIEKSY